GGAFQLASLMGWGASVGGVTLSSSELQNAYRHLSQRTYGDQYETPVPYLYDRVAHSEYDDYWPSRTIESRYADVTVPALNIGGWYDIFSKATIELTDRVRASSRDLHVRRSQLLIMGPWEHGVGVRKVGELDFGRDAALNLSSLQFRWFEYWRRDQNT